MAGYGSTAATASPSGSFVKLVNPEALKKGGASFQPQTVAFLVAAPLILYTIMILSWAFLSGWIWSLAAFLSFACFMICLLFWFYGRSPDQVQTPFYTFLAVLCFIATANGIASGCSVYDRYYGPYWNYKDRPVYTDVLATDLAASRADGGVINFADGALVDSTRMGSMQSLQGVQFCVAPILDATQQTNAEFWAVGMDCCHGRVGFFCNDAQDQDAKTGVVIYDTGDSSFTNDPYPYYSQAVKQAAARNQLEVPEKPVLVRWVKDVSKFMDAFWWDGSVHIVLATVLYGIGSAIVAVALHGMMSYAYPAGQANV